MRLLRNPTWWFSDASFRALDKDDFWPSQPFKWNRYLSVYLTLNHEGCGYVSTVLAASGKMQIKLTIGEGCLCISTPMFCLTLFCMWVLSTCKSRWLFIDAASKFFNLPLASPAHLHTMNRYILALASLNGTYLSLPSYIKQERHTSLSKGVSADENNRSLQ